MFKKFFEKCESGSTTVFGLSTLTMSLMVGGLAIDGANAYTYKAKLRSVAEAAAMGASLDLPNQKAARATALALVQANLPAAQHGTVVTNDDIVIGKWDPTERLFTQSDLNPDAIQVNLRKSAARGGVVPTYFLGSIGVSDWTLSETAVAVRSTTCIEDSPLGDITSYLFVFSNGHQGSKLDSTKHGLVGDIAVNGILAKEGAKNDTVFDGTLFTNDITLGKWNTIVTGNPTTATGLTQETTRISNLTTQINNAITNIRGMTVSPGYESRSVTSLNGLNTQNGVTDTLVINLTSGFKVETRVEITGDVGDTYFFRWDLNPASARFEGEVDFEEGGAFIPLGALKPSNFVHLAGDIDSGKDGVTPPEFLPYLSQLKSLPNGGGYFVGYWFTTGNKKYDTGKLGQSHFIGGWYTTTDKFSLKKDSSGVHVGPPLAGVLSFCHPATLRPVATHVM